MLLLLVFLLDAHASIFLVEPFERTLENNDFIDFGKIAQGETLGVVVQKKSAMDFEWKQLTIEQALPEGWGYKTVETDKTLIAMVSIPRNAEESIQKISFAVESGTSSFVKGSFSAYLVVKNNLLKASMEGLKQDVVVGETVLFKVLLNNESIAEHKVVISSTLPDYWFMPIEITVPALKTIDLNLSVGPYTYGVKNFSFNISSQLNDFSQEFPAELRVFSTLRGGFTSALYGFPFFTPSFLPHFIINAFLALLS